MFTVIVMFCLLGDRRGLAQLLSESTTVTDPQTATPSPTIPSGSFLPSQVQLPPQQDWCPSKIFCAGSLLQTVAIANLYSEDKIFVDKPTSERSAQVLADFTNLTVTPVTIGEIANFVNSDFRGEGLELDSLSTPNFVQDPAFLNNVSDSIVKAWSKTVHGYWTKLIRSTNSSAICGKESQSSCESSLIPLNHTFVVPGGRFREQYYWDSYWIVEGLIESELFDIVHSTLQNFMDEIERFGFIPNGGRIYYLNRSQPPLFVQMLSRYVASSGDRSILDRALPIAEKELTWWNDHRTVNVTSPFTDQLHTLYRFFVNNSAPRPESYLTDYMMANGPDIVTPLDETQRSNLYAELASGAESGWDYTVRWLSRGATDGLRNLNVRNTIPVDLNSILYRNHILLAQLYEGANNTVAGDHRMAAERLRLGILDLFWDSLKLAFYDFDLTTGTRNNVFTAASFYPIWSEIIPDEVLSGAEKSFAFFSSVNMALNRYNGSIPTTFVDSGLQWDAPNSWPPHQYIILQALRALPANVSGVSLSSLTGNRSTFDRIPVGQLGILETDLPGQPIRFSGTQNATTSGTEADVNRLNGTVSNGGNPVEGEGWAQTLQREVANRFIATAFCSWLATGGFVPGSVERLSDAELNVTKTIGNVDGNMFEKFSNLDVNAAGRGGEYTVQAGFGWTNGVTLWIASHYGDVLVAPQCPRLLDTSSAINGAHGGSSRSLLHMVIYLAYLVLMYGLLS